MAYLTNECNFKHLQSIVADKSFKEIDFEIEGLE